MPSIPIDVLREILEHVDKNDLATLCRVNKIVCSCSQDVLYRDLEDVDPDAIETLAQYTDLARRVRSFQHYCSFMEPETALRNLATALRNMSSLRSLDIGGFDDEPLSILDGCTFKLDSFNIAFLYSESIQKFLNSQPSLTNLTIWGDYEPLAPFDESCLPNLTRVMAEHSWLGMLIPGRPVREVTVARYGDKDSFDFRIFTLSTTPIRKLKITFEMLYPTPGSHLASIFPSLEHLTIDTYNLKWAVRIPPLYMSIRC